MLECWRGTCSYVGMLKGYIGREMLGTPGVTNAGRPKQRLGRGAVKELGAMEIYENQKIHFQ